MDYNVTDEALSEQEKQELTKGQHFDEDSPVWRAMARAALGLVRPGHKCTFKGKTHELRPNEIRPDSGGVPISLVAELLGTSDSSMWAIALEDRYDCLPGQSEGIRRFVVVLGNQNYPHALLPHFETNRHTRAKVDKKQEGHKAPKAQHHRKRHR